MTHTIIIEGSQPIPSQAYYTTGKMQEQIHTEIQSMLDIGVIKECDCSWASLVVLVLKERKHYDFVLIVENSVLLLFQVLILCTELLICLIF